MTAPVTLLFDDKDNDVYPLWGRVVSSFPADRLKSPAKKTSAAALPSSLANDLDDNTRGGEDFGQDES